MNAYGGVEVQLHAFLNSAYNGQDVQLRASAALPWESEIPSIHCRKGRLDPWAGQKAENS